MATVNPKKSILTRFETILGAIDKRSDGGDRPEKTMPIAMAEAVGMAVAVTMAMDIGHGLDLTMDIGHGCGHGTGMARAGS